MKIRQLLDKWERDIRTQVEEIAQLESLSTEQFNVLIKMRQVRIAVLEQCIAELGKCESPG